VGHGRRKHKSWWPSLNRKKELDGRVYLENDKTTKLSEDMETITKKVKWAKAVGNTRAGGTP
jgi:hypothetical protein